MLAMFSWHVISLNEFGGIKTRFVLVVVVS